MNAMANLDRDGHRPPPTAAGGLRPASGQVLDFMQRHLARALDQRVRYRYVKPSVCAQGDGFRIESPCCSRNVDPTGGVIDIALLMPHAADQSDGQPFGLGAPRAGWCLFSRDHAAGEWVWEQSSTHLEELLDVLCVDAQRRFWP